MNHTYPLAFKATIIILLLTLCSSHALIGQGVGVEDDTPDAALEVSANGGASDLLMLSSDDNNDGDLLIVKNSGAVGIGTTSPGTEFVVRDDAAGVMGPILTMYNGGGGAGSQAAIDFNTYDVGSNDPVARVFVYDNNYSGHIIFSSKTEGASANTLTERMRIESSGDVGIGTSTPGAKLHIEDLNNSMELLELATDNQDVDIRIGNNDDGGYGFYWRYMGTQTGNDNELELWSENTTNADIQVYEVEQDGEVNFLQNVGLGISAPSENLHIDGGAGNAAIRIETDDGYDSEIQFWDGSGVEVYRLRYDDTDNRFEIKGYNGGLTDRIRLPDGSDNIEGDGTFQDSQFGPSEWLIGQGEEGDVMCVTGAKEDEDGMIRAIAQVCDHANCPNVIGVAIPKDESPHHGNPDFEYKDHLLGQTGGEHWEKSWKKRHVGIELTGFRMTKVIGKVEVGDLLVASGVPGHAVASKEPGPGAVLGKATQAFSGKEGEKGAVWARIHLQSGSGLYEDVNLLKKSYNEQQKTVEALKAEVEKLKNHVREKDGSLINTASASLTPIAIILLLLAFILWKFNQGKAVKQ